MRKEVSIKVFFDFIIRSAGNWISLCGRGVSFNFRQGERIIRDKIFHRGD